ncbi:MAG: MarR family transcriptional regulator [Dehalobacterium sp.]
MTKSDTNAYANEYLHVCFELNAQYEAYAKSLGLSYSTLSALRIILKHDGDCTQKTICEYTFLPKQTVNAIVTGLLRHGAIRMSELDSDRRQKVIHFTDKGRQFAFEAIQKIKNAENKAMESLDESQRTAMLTAVRLYAARLRDYLLE